MRKQAGARMCQFTVFFYRQGVYPWQSGPSPKWISPCGDCLLTRFSASPQVWLFLSSVEVLIVVPPLTNHTTIQLQLGWLHLAEGAEYCNVSLLCARPSPGKTAPPNNTNNQISKEFSEETSTSDYGGAQSMTDRRRLSYSQRIQEQSGAARSTGKWLYQETVEGLKA